MTHGSLPRFAVVTLDEISDFCALSKGAQRAILAVRMFADPRAPLDPSHGCRKSIADLAAVAACDRRAMARGLADASAAGWIRVLDPGDPQNGVPAVRSVLGPGVKTTTTPRCQNDHYPGVKTTTAVKGADPLTDPVGQLELTPPTIADGGGVYALVDRALYEARKTACPDRRASMGNRARTASGRRVVDRALRHATPDQLLDAIARLGRLARRQPTYMRDGAHVPMVNLICIEHFARNDGERIHRYLRDPSLDSGAGSRGVAFVDPANEDPDRATGDLSRLSEWRGA